MNRTIDYWVMAAVIVALAALAVAVGVSTQPTFASVPILNEYHATSTAPNALFGAQTVPRLNVRGNTLPVQGTLGSVIITGANTGVLNFYDATTTNVNLRAANKATSTILIASLPTALVAGTYTFDVEYTDGLLYDLYGGIMPTTTITYR